MWLLGARNPYTPAGYVGYLTKGAVFGKARFHGIQRGPTSAGRSWLLDVTNVSITPYTYNEDFTRDDAVLSRDNLKIAFRVHTVWHVDDTRIPLFMERFSTTSSEQDVEKDPDAIVKVAYGHFVREPLRTYARDEVQRRNGMEVKDALIPIGDAVLARIRAYTAGSPFVISSVVVGNVQYRKKWRARCHASSRPHRSCSGKTPKSRSSGRSARSARCRLKASPMRCRSSGGQLSPMYDPARSDRSAEADGELAESHGGVHPDGPIDNEPLRSPAAGEVEAKIEQKS